MKYKTQKILLTDKIDDELKDYLPRLPPWKAEGRGQRAEGLNPSSPF
jgi:hypothetical protein